MVRTGIVVDRAPGQLIVAFERPEACAQCGRCDGGRHAHRVNLAGEAELGDRVTVELPEAGVTATALMAYAVPLACVLLPLALSATLRVRLAPGMSEDRFAGLCALAGLAVAALYWKLVDRRIRGKRRWTPQIVAVQRNGEKNG
jgi:positive regulator of sigma E activity